MNKFLSISEVSKILDFVDPKTKKPKNHILRYWEKEFRIIKPKIINKRRYYDSNQLEIIKMIKFFLKTEGMTVLGAKKMIKIKLNKLDGYNNDSLKAEYYRKNLKAKSKLLLDRINKIKFYGKKNSS